MLHFSCDLCGQPLDDRRFVVKMQVFAAFDPEEIDEDDLDADHLQAISEKLEQIEATGIYDLEDCSSKGLRFDLCSECHKRFLKDPLGRDALRRLNFSEN